MVVGTRSADRIRLWLVATPIYVYLFAFWFVEVTSLGGNISVAYLVPVTFLTGLLIVRVDRGEFLELLGRVRIEFSALLVMVFLGLLSMFNSEEPFRAFRVLFPCALPLLIFLQLCALRAVSVRALEGIPRVFLYLAVVGSSLPLLASMLVPAFAGPIFTRNRLEGFLENPNQLSLVLAALIPVMIGELAVAKRAARRLGLGILFLLLIYTLLRTGSKTALGVSLACCSVAYLVINFRSSSPLKRLVMVNGTILGVFLLATFGLQFAAMVDPDLGLKLKMVVSGGVGNYYSIESRQVLWDEAIRLGSQHWLVGAGAGVTILGNSHAHNLVLDYFRGIGVFGAAAVSLLCLVIMFRAAAKGWSLLGRRVGDREKRVFACYVAAVVYVLCNQLSDCFGPSTVAVLWFLYLPGVMMDRPLMQRAHAAARQRAGTLTLQPNTNT